MRMEQLEKRWRLWSICVERLALIGMKTYNLMRKLELLWHWELTN